MQRKKARVDTSVEKLNKKDTIEHYNAVMLEDIKSGIKLIQEGVDSSHVELKNELHEFRDETRMRLTAVEFAVMKNSKDIKSLDQRFDGLDKKVDSVRTELKEDMVKMEKRLSDKIDGIVTHVDDHENRITKLETTTLHPAT